MPSRTDPSGSTAVSGKAVCCLCCVVYQNRNHLSILSFDVSNFTNRDGTGIQTFRDRRTSSVKRKRDLWIRNALLPFFFSVVLLGSLASVSCGEEESGLKWGFSLGVGHPQKSSSNLNLWTFFPRVDVPVSKNWEFEVEGNASYYDISGARNLYVLGVNTNILFKLLRWGDGELFLLGGVGLGYDNNGSGKVPDLGDSHTAGILQCGTGILYRVGKNLWVRGEYRFHHISDPFYKDGGINTHNALFGVTF